MKSIKIFLIGSLIIFSLIPKSNAQELNCTVTIGSTLITNGSQQLFQSMQMTIYEFMNTTKWTEYAFNYDERIECNISINLKSYNGVDKFTATIQVTSSRPIFNSDYNSTILNIKEPEGSMTFYYVENQPLIFNENSYTSNLISVLAFYAYIVIGADFDTFSEYGGTAFFNKAQKIVTTAQSSEDPSWKAYSSTSQDNRYYVAEAFNNNNYKSFRSALYKYHRLGLDVMHTDLTGGRKEIKEAIDKILLVYKKKKDSHLLTMFFDAKANEIVNIYSEAPTDEIKEVYEILKVIDVANASKYEEMGKKK